MLIKHDYNDFDVYSRALCGSNSICSSDTNCCV